jgi:uncharacterized paraquat-inducible protein A
MSQPATARSVANAVDTRRNTPAKTAGAVQPRSHKLPKEEKKKSAVVPQTCCAKCDTLQPERGQTVCLSCNKPIERREILKS